MDESSKEFAREIVAAFGEDRFYHALMRLGNAREAKALFVALGGENWYRKCDELGLRTAMPDLVRDNVKLDDAVAKEVLSRTIYTIALHHKEFALRRPVMPPSIHARMLLGEQNEWTKKYIEAIKED